MIMTMPRIEGVYLQTFPRQGKRHPKVKYHLFEAATPEDRPPPPAGEDAGTGEMNRQPMNMPFDVFKRLVSYSVLPTVPSIA